MSKDTFNILRDLLDDKLNEEFGEVNNSGRTPTGPIPTKLRLSAALRFCAGSTVYDIMATHGLGYQTVYNCVYGVANVVNNEPTLAFNANGATFPSHKEQYDIAAGFKEMSGADFDKIVLTIDGMLVWTRMPSEKESEELEIGQRLFPLLSEG